MARQYTVRLVGMTGVLVFLCAILAQPQERENDPPAVTPEIAAAYVQISAEFELLRPIFKVGCFDCHSDQTDFPWYHSLPIIGSWMDGHIAEAREELDFSAGFPFGGRRARQADNLLKIKREIEEGAMPLRSYRMVHWGAAPNEAEKDSIYSWVDRSLILLASHGQYPFNKPENVPPAR